MSQCGMLKFMYMQEKEFYIATKKWNDLWYADN